MWQTYRQNMVRKTMLSTAAALALGGLGLGGFVSTAAAEKKLQFNKFIPSKHPYQVLIMDAWAKDVAKATSNRVKIEFTGSSLAPPPKQFGLVRSGGADLAFSFVGYNPDRFTRTNMLALPMLGPSAEKTTAAYWKMHAKTFAPQNEFKGVKLITIWANMPGYIFTKAPVRKLADYAGVKVRVGDRILAETVRRLGGTPVFSPAPRSYQMLSRGILTGAAFPAADVAAFKVQEFIPHAVKVPGGVFSGAFYIMMNQRAWDALGADDRKAITAISNETLALRAAKAIDKLESRAQAVLTKQGAKMWTPDEAFMKAARARFKEVEAAWIKRATKDGFDAATILAEFRKLAGSNAR